MLDKLPVEIIIVIFHFLSLYDIVTAISISEKYKTIIETTVWRIKNLCLTSINYKILIKYNFRIHKLRIFNFFNLIGLHYKTLYFNNSNLPFAKSLIDMDSEISEKCKKISFRNCKLYSLLFILSLKYLKKCKHIKFFDRVEISNIGSVYKFIHECTILTNTKTLPNLCKISLTNWKLDQYCLNLLSNHETIILKEVLILDNISFIQNFSEIRLSTCFLNNYLFENRINDVIKGKYKKIN